MMLSPHLTIWGMIIISCISVVICALCFKHDERKAIHMLGVFQLAATSWVFGYIIELSSHSYNWKLFGLVLQYTGLPILPVLSFAIAIELLAPRVFLLRRRLAYLYIIPGITYLLLCSNNLHHLYFRSARVIHIDGLLGLDFIRGEWYYVQMFYSYGMFLAGAIAWFYYLVVSGKLFGLKSISIVAAIGLPCFANMMFVVQGNGHIDNTSLALIISGGLFYIGINTSGKIDIIPAARERLFESMRDAVIVIDSQTRVIDMNTSAIRLVGNKKLLGKYIFELRTQLPLNIINLFMNSVGESEVVVNDKTYAALISVLVNESGVEQGKIISLRDISERKKDEDALLEADKVLRESEKQLIEQNASKDRLFSIIAHDLKSPFTAIIGLTEILVEEFNSLDRAGQLKFLSDLKTLSENTLKLLENLLQWAGSRTGKIMFRPKTLDMKLIASNAIIALYHMADQKHIKLISMIPPDIQIYGDEEMIGSVLRNLIGNAIKFSRQGGSVMVGGKRTNEGIVITVADKGVGLSSKEKEIIFSMGHMYSQRGTAGENGTGLGLILCKEFMDKHQGKIWVESEEGHGATFYLLFPERDYYIVTN
jgi:PAS domain S-box-containing protein